MHPQAHANIWISLLTRPLQALDMRMWFVLCILLSRPSSMARRGTQFSVSLDGRKRRGSISPKAQQNKRRSLNLLQNTNKKRSNATKKLVWYFWGGVMARLSCLWQHFCECVFSRISARQYHLVSKCQVPICFLWVQTCKIDIVTLHFRGCILRESIK